MIDNGLNTTEVTAKEPKLIKTDTQRVFSVENGLIRDY